MAKKSKIAKNEQRRVLVEGEDVWLRNRRDETAGPLHREQDASDEGHRVLEVVAEDLEPHPREQVEERLKFFDSGETPRRNVDVMQEVAAALRAERGEDVDMADAPSSSKKDKKKQKD